MKNRIYLVYVLIQYSAESITDAHYAYSTLEKAKAKMALELEGVKENFNMEGGEIDIDTDLCQEWSNDCGQNYCVGIEEMEIK